MSDYIKGQQDMRERIAQAFDLRVRNTLGGRAKEAMAFNAKQVRDTPVQETPIYDA